MIREKGSLLILWVGELSAHCKKDLPGSIALLGEREGRPGQQSSRGGQMIIFKRQKNDIPYSTNVKSMSQGKGSSTNTVT
jgi:hypothetical protein